MQERKPVKVAKYLDRLTHCSWCECGFRSGGFDLKQYVYRKGDKFFCGYACYMNYLRSLEKR